MTRLKLLTSAGDKNEVCREKGMQTTSALHLASSAKCKKLAAVLTYQNSRVTDGRWQEFGLMARARAA